MNIYKMQNGLTIALYPIENAQSVEIGLYIRAGSKYENKNNNGITHLLEHMHFKQLCDMSQEDIYYETECMGTTLCGTTYKEFLHFKIKIRPRYIYKSLDLFERIISFYDWNEKQLEEEKKVVLNELKEKENDIYYQNLHDETIFKDKQLSKPILGKIKNIEKIDLKRIRNYKKNIFSENNIILVVTGIVAKDTKKYIDEHFGKLSLYSEFKVHKKKMNKFVSSKKRIILENHTNWELLDVQISFNVDLNKIKEKELLFLNSIVGGGDGSYLQKNIRDRLNMVYDIYSICEIYSDEAVLSISFSIESKKLEICLNEIIKILSNLKNNISKRDIDMNIVFFTENLWYWLEESHNLNFQIGQDFINRNKILSIEDRINENNKINENRMREISKLLFQNNNMSTIIIGNTQNISFEKIDSILEL